MGQNVDDQLGKYNEVGEKVYHFSILIGANALREGSIDKSKKADQGIQSFV